MWTDGPRFAAFCREFVRQTKGRWAGDPLVLEPSQEEFFDEALRGEGEHRLYQNVVWLLPRKGGKSTTGSAFGLYMTGADGEPGSDVYIAASAKEQATIVFKPARDFVEASPPLGELFTVRRNYIECLSSRSTLKVIASNAPQQHGWNPHANVVDELWAHESPELYTALTTGSGARQDPLTLGISTVGWNMDTLLGQIVEAAMKKRDIERRPNLTIVRDREGKFLLWWHHATMDEDGNVDPDDIAAIKAGNPASWITEEYLRTERNRPDLRVSDFLRLHGNVWTKAEEIWLPKGARKAAHHPEVAMREDLPLAVGIDIAATHDYTAVILAQRQPGEVSLRKDTDAPEAPEDRTVWRARFWYNPWPVDDPRHSEWELNTSEVRDYLRYLYGRFQTPAAFKPDTKVPCPGPAYVTDPYLFKESMEILRGEGLNMIAFPQWDRYMVPATNTTYELLATGRICHTDAADEGLQPGGHAAILWEHFENAVGDHRDRGWRLRKPKGPNGKILEEKHIDGAQGAIMATAQAQVPPPPPRKKRIAAGF